MNGETQRHSQTWYLRRAGQIEGPYPLGMISRYVLLGRIGHDDELSCDLVHWHPLSALPELIPVVMKGDPEDALARERLAAARRWEDERGTSPRRREQQPVTAERRRGERRSVEHGETGVRHSLPSGRDGRPEADRSVRSQAAVVALGILLVVLAVLLFAPRKEPAGIIDCDRPAVPGVNWSNCFKEGISLPRADLRHARLQNMKLSGADLSGAHLQAAELSYTELSVASLREAHLEGAVLIGTSLRGSDLRGADLRRANLAYADLSGAALQGADLREAVLDNAIWTDGRYCGPGSVGQCLFTAAPPRDRL